MSADFQTLTKEHPCFSLDQKGVTGRIHLPVSPGCNIACKFCKRSINEHEQRPGVASCVITPQEAVEAVGRGIELCENLKVVGIAGPGDTLATPFALETFRFVKKAYPEMLCCMSTNGLLLKEKAQEIIEVGIDSLTVTVNAVDPEILIRINDEIRYQDELITGIKAAKILIENQLEGIRLVTKAGITVKVNTVLIPDINGDHIKTVAQTVKDAGASLYNIIPLIPQHRLSDQKEPTCAEISQARKEAEEHILVFRHCQRCRADAVGVPGGENFSDRVYQRKILIEETFSHG